MNNWGITWGTPEKGVVPSFQELDVSYKFNKIKHLENIKKGF